MQKNELISNISSEGGSTVSTVSTVSMATGGDDAPVEYEYQFELKDAKEELIKESLKKLGAKRQGEYLMYVTVYNSPAEDGQNPEEPLYIRIRRETPDMVTFTVKSGPLKFRVEREIEVNPSDGKTLHDMMLDMGNTVKYRVEKIRELWTFPPNNKHAKVKEVVFDWVPGLPKYMEIDAHTKKALHAAMKDLGLREQDRISEKVDGYKYFYEIPTVAEGRKIPPGAGLVFAPSALNQFVDYLDADGKKRFKAILKKQIAHAEKLRANM